MSSSEEKTEQPTAHKLREARKRGDVAYSKELTGAATFTAVFLTVWIAGSFIKSQLHVIVSTAFDVVALIGQSAKTEAVMSAMEQMVIATLWIVAPVLIAAFLVAFAVGLLQTRGVFSAEPLHFKFERLNPAESLKQLFSTKQLGVFVQMVLKVGFLFGAIALVGHVFLEPMVMGIYGATANSGSASSTAIYTLFAAAAGVMLILAIVDFIQQNFEYIKRNRMSKTEVKREHKDQDGDPMVKGELRVLRREMLEGSKGGGVASANVIVTNPTHFAVALYYEPGVVELPMVVAKGEDDTALAMRVEAGQRNIPIMENPPLARALHRSVGLGEFIGDEHIEPVAEVFKWLAALKSGSEQNKLRH